MVERDVSIYSLLGTLRGSGNLIVKLLALAFPVLLFIFKYILPSIAEAAFKNTKREKEQVKIELIHFPVDLLFVAISYTVPQLVEVITELLAIWELKDLDINLCKELISNFVRYFSLSIFVLLLIPFYVFGTKVAEKWYFSKNIKGMYGILIPSYILGLLLIWLSIFN